MTTTRFRYSAIFSDAITMWRSPDEWHPLPAKDPDAAAATAAADPVEAAIDAIEDDQKGSILGNVIEHMKADEDTGKEPEIQKLTPRSLSVRIAARADWKTCEHRGPPDGKRGTRLWRPGGCPCDQPHATPPGLTTSNLTASRRAKPCRRAKQRF